MNVSNINETMKVSAPQTSMTISEVMEMFTPEVDTTDTDEDGLTDVDEEKYGTDKDNPDTDGDGYLDGDEVDNGYNPNGEGELPVILELDTTPMLDISGVIMESQDAKRIADMQQVQNALELYYNTNNKYPICTSIVEYLGDISACPDANEFETYTTGLNNIYDRSAGEDSVACTTVSTNPCNYAYSSTDGETYSILFFLEGTSELLESGLNTASLSNRDIINTEAINNGSPVL